MIKSTILGLLLSTAAFANYTETSTANSIYNQDMKIASVTITEVAPTKEELQYSSIDAGIHFYNLADDALDWSQVITIGKQVFEIIKEGAPVVNITRDAVAVVPAGVSDWRALQGWAMPVTKVYQMKMSNVVGIDMVDVRLKVSANYGGSVDGRGAYLANVVVVPTTITVRWGVTLDVWSEYHAPVNIGTLASPVAGLGFDIRYKAKTWVTEINGTQDYFVSGKGQITEMQ